MSDANIAVFAGVPDLVVPSMSPLCLRLWYFIVLFLIQHGTL
jgi:hypothetical protein